MYVKPEASCRFCCLTRKSHVTHICVSKLTTIDSDKGLSPGRCQAIIWINAGILFIETIGTNFGEILGEIHIFSFIKRNLKMPSVKWRPFCLGLSELRDQPNDDAPDKRRAANHYFRINACTIHVYGIRVWNIGMRFSITHPSHQSSFAFSAKRTKNAVMTSSCQAWSRRSGISLTLRWRHNGRDGTSNHQPRDCLLNSLFRRRSKQTSKLRVTDLCAGNSPHKGPVKRKMFPFDDVIMNAEISSSTT